MVVRRELSAVDHPEKEVRAVLDRLVVQGWKLRKEGHRGRLYRPCGGGA
ncbi:hypothetical protein [Streptomyces beigongshangae]|nr:hypothetical protein [Streptomyces sp. REN17]